MSAPLLFVPEIENAFCLFVFGNAFGRSKGALGNTSRSVTTCAPRDRDINKDMVC